MQYIHKSITNSHPCIPGLTWRNTSSLTSTSCACTINPYKYTIDNSKLHVSRPNKESSLKHFKSISIQITSHLDICTYNVYPKQTKYNDYVVEEVNKLIRYIIQDTLVSVQSSERQISIQFIILYVLRKLSITMKPQLSFIASHLSISKLLKLNSLLNIHECMQSTNYRECGSFS